VTEYPRDYFDMFIPRDVDSTDELDLMLPVAGTNNDLDIVDFEDFTNK
jgi:hypothetical protein